MAARPRRRKLAFAGVIVAALALLAVEGYAISPGVRRAVAGLNESLGRWDALVAQLDDADAGVQTAAAAALAGHGAEPVPALVRGLGTLQPAGRVFAAATVERLGADARPALPALEERYRRDREPAVRAAAIRAAVAVGLDDAAVRDGLAERLRTGPGADRVAVVEAIQAAGVKAATMVGPLAGALTDESAAVRRAAAVALGEVGPAAAAALPALVAAVQDADPDVRAEAAETLGGLGPAARPAAAALTAALNDDHERVRKEAAEALEAIGPEPSKP